MRIKIFCYLLFIWLPAVQAQTVKFEIPSILDAASLLSNDIVIGEGYRIDKAVENDGRNNTYRITSDIQSSLVTTDSFVEERTQEIIGIVSLRKIKETDVYKKGLEAAAEAPLTLTKHVIEDPVGALEKLPAGLNNLLNDLGAAVSSIGRGDDSNKEDNAMVKDLLGFNAVKRRLAAEMKVDPYSSNTILQKELNDVAWAMFAGGAPIELAMAVAPAVVSVAVRAIDRLDGGQLDWKIPPSSIRYAMHESVQTLGLSAEESEKLVYHKRCSLRHQSIMVSAILDMKEVSGRDEYLRQVTVASDELTCRRKQQLAELAWSYHRHIQPVKSMTLKENKLWLETTGQQRVLVLSADYLAWTKDNAALLDNTSAGKPVALWLSGRVSETTAKELQQRQITLHQQVNRQHTAYVHVAAVLLPDRVAEAGAEDQQNKTGKLVNDVGSGVGNLIGDVFSIFDPQTKPQDAGKTELETEAVE